LSERYAFAGDKRKATMPLILPNLKDRRCLDLDLCGTVVLDEAGSELSLPSLDTPLVAQYLNSGIEAYLGLVLPFPGKNEKKHVHLRITLRELIRENDPPTVNATTEQILALVEPLIGRTIAVELDGRFRVPQSEVSAIIRSTFVETTADQVHVRLTGGTL
jgi:hypothetical protein